MSGALLTLERLAITAAVLLTGTLFLSSLADPVNVVKLTALLICALVAVVSAVVRVTGERIVRLPTDPAAWAALALLVALVVATISAPMATTAIVGTYGRNSGLLAYGAALVLFFLGARVWDAATTPILLLGSVVAGLLTASYGLLQYAGIDPIAWNNPFNPIIATLGNPDFASAYVGICVPAAVWGALWDRWALPWRIVSGLSAVMFLTAAVLSHAIQGLAATAVGLTVLTAAWLLEQRRAVARGGLTALGGVAALGIATTLAGAAKVGPASFIFTRGSSQAREWYWEAALTMFRHHPVLGVGLDHYGAFFRQVRPDAATARLGGSEFSDAAHSVPLQMLAQGGVVLGVAYLAFIVLVALTLVRGLVRLQGPPRLLLGAVGGMWAAYVVQAAVSIDQVPLLTIEFAAAGAVVALGGKGLKEVRLRGALTPVEGRGRRRGVAVQRERTWTGTDTAIAGTVIVAGLVAFWFALYPLRANAAARSGDIALQNAQGNAALTDFQKANSLLPGVGAYWLKTGALYEAVKQPSLALDAYRRGAEHDPFDISLLLSAARLAADQKDFALQGRMLHRAGLLDPTNAGPVEQVAAYDAGHGDLPGARAALDRALRAITNDSALWAASGQVRAALGDKAGARAAFQRALEIQADNSTAKHGLALLDGTG
jgi:putative inorganic carbon (HCO3(-)) transporter